MDIPTTTNKNNDDCLWLECHQACCVNDVPKLIRCLNMDPLERFDPNYQPVHCPTGPLFAAIRHGHDSCVRILMEAGASATRIEGRTGLTPVQVAHQSGQLFLVDLLVQGLSPIQQKEAGLQTILVSGPMRRECWEYLASTGHRILVEDSGESMEKEMAAVEQIQRSTQNKKFQTTTMQRSELELVTEVILRPVDGTSVLEFLADFYPSMTLLERIIIITTQCKPISPELSWLLLNNNKVTALLVPFWWDVTLDVSWKVKWHETILWLLTTQETVEGTLYNYRRQVVVSPWTEHSHVPHETELWNHKYRMLLTPMVRKSVQQVTMYQKGRRVGVVGTSPSLLKTTKKEKMKKKKMTSVIPWCNCNA